MSARFSSGIHSLLQDHSFIEVIAEMDRKVQECRICLQNAYQFNSDDRMIICCKCRGSLQFFHEKCMIKWILTITKGTYELISNKRSKIQCQICKSDIIFELESKIEWNKLEQIRQLSKNDQVCLVIQVILIAVILSFMIYCIFLFFTLLVAVSRPLGTIIILSICLIATLICLIVVIVRMTKHYLIKISRKIMKVIQVEEINESNRTLLPGSKIKSNRVHPLQIYTLNQLNPS